MDRRPPPRPRPPGRGRPPHRVDDDPDPLGEGGVPGVGEPRLLGGALEQAVDRQRTVIADGAGHAVAPTRRRISSSVSRTLSADRAANAWPAMPL